MKRKTDAQSTPRHFEVFRYSMAAASHLISGLSESELKRINNIVLFGSAARFTASEESDIDIFVDVHGSKRFQLALRAKLNKIAEQFYLTSTALEFKSRGIDNELSVKVGKLEEWKELAQSMASHGIILYGKYIAKPPDTNAYTILSWETKGKSKGALLNKIYGYKANNKRYPGMLGKFGGTKIGKATVMVPAESRDIFIDALEKYKVNYSRHDIWK